MHMIFVTPDIELNEDELHFQFVLASGPGGQNVNKVATAVQLRFDINRSTALSGDVRTRLRHLAGTRLTRDGVLVITARRFRTQARNRADAIERLVLLIRKAAIRPRPRRTTKPSAAVKRRRREDKRRRGERKRERAPVKLPPA